MVTLLSSIPSLRVECETPGRVVLSTYGYYVTATWDSVPGGQYVISAATNIRGPWQVAPTEPTPLTATGDQMTYALSPAAGVQFYRVMELPTFKPAGMVWISPGTFDMGSPVDEEGRQPDESPQHPVTIEEGFWMAKYEVTKAAASWMSAVTSGAGFGCRFVGPGRVYVQTRSPYAFGAWAFPYLPLPTPPAAG